MSKELIKNYYEAFNSGDRARMLSFLDDHVEHDLNQGKTQKGKEQFQKFMQHMDECYKEKLEDMVIFYDDKSGRGSAEFVVHGFYLKTDGSLPPARNQEYRIKAGAFFQIKEHKIARVTTYYNLPQWIELVSSVK